MGEIAAAYTAFSFVITMLAQPVISVIQTPLPIFETTLSSVCLWSVNKKKPLSKVKQAHGYHGDRGLEQPHWVSSVAALLNSDTVASGASGCESS